MLVLGPSLTVEYRTIVVPVKRTGESEEALVAAARLAAERGATVAIVHVIEVPLSLPLDAKLPEEQDDAEALLDDAQALVESYGVRAVTRLLRARRAGPRDRRGGPPPERRARGARRPPAAHRRPAGALRRHRRLRPAGSAVPGADRGREAGGVNTRRRGTRCDLGAASSSSASRVIVEPSRRASAAGSACLGAMLVAAGALRLYLATR